MTNEEQAKAQEFLEEYQALCAEYGLQIVSSPEWRARDDGTWSMLVRQQIGNYVPQNSSQ